jgi:hypothetical protein
LAASQNEFRATYREQEIGKHYSGWGHFLFTTCGALLAIVAAASRLHDVRPVEWAVVPLAFLLANFVEYLAHRYVMHHPRPGLFLIYKRHTLQHHHFFTHDAMAAESPRDFKMVLFPPILLVFFLGAIATPVGAILYVLVSPSCGLLFAIVAVAYFLLYEWLHLSYHQPDDAWVLRLPLLRRLQRYHGRHHDLGLMGSYHFNIVFPIADHVLGTTYSEAPGDGRGRRRRGA